MKTWERRSSINLSKVSCGKVLKSEENEHETKLKSNAFSCHLSIIALLKTNNQQKTALFYQVTIKEKNQNKIMIFLFVKLINGRLSEIQSCDGEKMILKFICSN